MGLFTAPVKGIYYFSTVLTKEHNTRFHIWSRKKGETTPKLLSNSYNNNDNYDSMPISLTIELRVGDNIFIQHNHGEIDGRGSTYFWHTFSGFLINSLD